MSARTPVSNPARTPEALHAIIEDAFNRGDLVAYLDAYADDAALIVPPDGRSALGRDEIRAASAPLFALEPHMTMVVRKKLETDGLALTHGQWKLTITPPGGARVTLSGRGTMVSRRQTDGTWRIVLDDPLRPE